MSRPFALSVSQQNIHRTQHASVGPPAEKTRRAITGALTGKKVETKGIVPHFLRMYPKNLGEVERHSEWDK
jgi:hypothetical protein